MCIMIIKKAIPKAFRGSMSEKATTTKENFANVEQRFVKDEKAKIGMLLTSLISIRYMGKCKIMEYIMEMSYLTSELRVLKLEFFEDLLVHLVLISLPI